MCLISHKYKFIFIRVRKTASSSMHVAFSKFCGPIDIITHIGDKDEVDMMKNEDYTGEQNNWRYLPSKTPVFYNHIPAYRVREMINEQSKYIWDDYFKFCFERNPWDKSISQYYFHNQRTPTSRKGMNDFIMSGGLYSFSEYGLYSEWSPQMDKYGRFISKTDEFLPVIVDHVGHYEKMNEEFEFIRDKLELPNPIIMPKKRLKGWTRKDHRHYREVLTDQERVRIAEVFKKEIKEFVFEY